MNDFDEGAGSTPDALTNSDAPGVPVVRLESAMVSMERQEAPPFGSLSSLSIGAASEAVQILPQSPKRSRAVITIVPTDSESINSYVLLGRREQVQNGVGARLNAGMQLEYQAQAEVWLFAKVAADDIIVTVLDERYQ